MASIADYSISVTEVLKVTTSNCSNNMDLALTTELQQVTQLWPPLTILSQCYHALCCKSLFYGIVHLTSMKGDFKDSVLWYDVIEAI